MFETSHFTGYFRLHLAEDVFAVLGEHIRDGFPRFLNNQIVGIDEQGESKLLFNGESGRIYRLDNIDQAVHDLNGKSIRQKGTYRHIYAVLSDTTFVMDSNQTPRPSTLADAGIEQKIDLSVDNIRVTKDQVTAIYTTNCQAGASL